MVNLKEQELPHPAAREQMGGGSNLPDIAHYDGDGAVSQTTYRGMLRNYGKTKKSLRAVHLPEGMANDLWLWKQDCPPDSSPHAFIFPNPRKRNRVIQNSVIRTDNYHSRVLKKLKTELGLPKLNFQSSGTASPTSPPTPTCRRSRASVKQTQAGIYSELVAPAKLLQVS